MRLTREQLDRYDEDGYVIVPDFLSAEEVGVLAADADILGPRSADCPRATSTKRTTRRIRRMRARTCTR